MTMTITMMKILVPLVKFQLLIAYMKIRREIIIVKAPIMLGTMTNMDVIHIKTIKMTSGSRVSEKKTPTFTGNMVAHGGRLKPRMMI